MLASRVLPLASPSESPNTTTGPWLVWRSTSTPDRKNQQQVRVMVKPVPLTSLARSVEPTKLVCRVVPWKVVGPVGVGKYTVTTRSCSLPTARLTGSLSSSAPLFITADGLPPKLNWCRDAASMSDFDAVLVLGLATVACPTVTAWSPSSLDSLIRTWLPLTVVCTISRTDWSLKPLLVEPAESPWVTAAIQVPAHCRPCTGSGLAADGVAEASPPEPVIKKADPSMASAPVTAVAFTLNEIDISRCTSIRRSARTPGLWNCQQRAWSMGTKGSTAELRQSREC